MGFTHRYYADVLSGLTLSIRVVFRVDFVGRAPINNT